MTGPARRQRLARERQQSGDAMIRSHPTNRTIEFALVTQSAAYDLMYLLFLRCSARRPLAKARMPQPVGNMPVARASRLRQEVQSKRAGFVGDMNERGLDHDGHAAEPPSFASVPLNADIIVHEPLKLPGKTSGGSALHRLHVGADAEIEVRA